MKIQPNALLSRFERLILRTLDFGFYGAALYYLWHRAWVLGVLILLLSFGTGAIGQSLPHRKQETYSELAAGATLASGPQGEISNEDSLSLGSALFKTSTLLCVTLAFILGHEGLRWFWILLVLIALWPLSFAAFLTLTVGPIRIVQNMKRHHRLY
jgi:hypothetical protein